MTRLLSHQSALILLLLPTFAAAQGLVEYCPSEPWSKIDPPCGSDPDCIDPLDLPWDLDGGGTAYGVRPGDAIQVLSSYFPAENSTCEISTNVTVVDRNGSQLIAITGSANSSNPLSTLEYGFTDSDIPAGQRSTVFIDVEGTATGCTTAELRSFRSTLFRLEPPLFAEASNVSLVGFGSFAVKSRNARTPRFKAGKQLKDALNGAALNCPGGTKPWPRLVLDLKNEGVDPVDLIWDVDDGGTTQAQQANSNLLVFVTPTILKQSCRQPGAVVDFLPKVKIELVFLDEQGNRTILEGELDAANPEQSFPFPEGVNGGRKQYAFQLEAQSPGCIAANGGRVGVVLIAEDDVANGATRYEQQLPLIVRKLSPGLNGD